MHFVVPVGDNCYNLEVKVLQCIRILETSPVMTKLISALFLSSNAAPLGEFRVGVFRWGKPNARCPSVTRLRCGLRFVGLGHFLVGESGIGLDRSKVDQAQEIHDVAVVVYGGVSRVDVWKLPPRQR